MSDKINIAIVDDHGLFRKSLTVLIDLFPEYKAIYDAANGKDFITQLQPEALPEKVPMDINMSIMDGYVTTHWLRENYPGIKVLALSTMLIYNIYSVFRVS